MPTQAFLHPYILVYSPCNGGSKVTSCRACYYDDEERSVPKKCRYRCGENPKKKCLRKWAKCVAKKYKKKFGTVSAIHLPLVSYGNVHISDLECKACVNDILLTHCITSSLII